MGRHKALRRYNPEFLAYLIDGKKIASGLLSPLRMACSFMVFELFQKVDQASLAIGGLDGLPRCNVADGWYFFVYPVVKLP